MATSNCSGPRSAANPTLGTAGADAGITTKPPAGLPEFGGLTVAQVVIVLQSIASAAIQLRQLAQHAAESGHADAMVAYFELVEVLGSQIGGMADQASGSQCAGNLMHWLCGPVFDEAGAKGGAA